MTRALEENPDTHFLESLNITANSFTSEKKIKFLELATNHIVEKKEMPQTLSLCQAVGIGIRTFEKHLEWDHKFKECWLEVRAKINSILTEDLYVKSRGKMGTLALLALLRYNESQKWNQEQTINHVTDNSSSKTLLSSVNDYIEADIVQDSKQLDVKK